MQMMEGSRFAALYMRSVAENQDISWCQNDHPAAQYCRIAPGEEKVRSDGMDLPPSVKTRTAYPPEYCL